MVTVLTYKYLVHLRHFYLLTSYSAMTLPSPALKDTNIILLAHLALSTTNLKEPINHKFEYTRSRIN